MQTMCTISKSIKSNLLLYIAQLLVQQTVECRLYLNIWTENKSNPNDSDDERWKVFLLCFGNSYTHPFKSCNIYIYTTYDTHFTYTTHPLYIANNYHIIWLTALIWIWITLLGHTRQSFACYSVVIWTWCIHFYCGWFAVLIRCFYNFFFMRKEKKRKMLISKSFNKFTLLSLCVWGLGWFRIKIRFLANCSCKFELSSI